MLVALLSVAWAGDPPQAGLGAYVRLAETLQLPAITLPFAGSPAEKAGLLPGDVIVSIDGWPTKGEPIETVIQHLVGPDKTEVVLSLLRLRVPLEIRVRRAPTAALAAEQVRVEREVCPAFWAALKDEDPTFADLRGAPVGDPEDLVFAAQSALPTAEFTRLEDSGFSVTWRAQFGTFPKEAERNAALDAAVARFRPCLNNFWVSRERDVRNGRPIVYFGRANPIGWFESAGAFRVGADDVVDVYVSGGDQRMFAAMVGEPRGPWVSAMETLVAEAPKGFPGLRGAPHTERSLVNSFTWYDATLALPGAADCRIQGGSAMVPADTFYQCTIANNVAPDVLGSTFDKALEALQATLGAEWVQWGDRTDPSFHGRRFRHFAKRTNRVYEKTTVITLGLSETAVTVSVIYQGV